MIVNLLINPKMVICVLATNFIMTEQPKESHFLIPSEFCRENDSQEETLFDFYSIFK